MYKLDCENDSPEYALVDLYTHFGKQLEGCLLKVYPDGRVEPEENTLKFLQFFNIDFISNEMRKELDKNSIDYAFCPLCEGDVIITRV